MTENGAFEDLVSVGLLELDKNKIDAIGLDTFRGLTSVKQLLLQQNHIRHIAPGSFDGIFKQSTFNPRANPKPMLVLSHNSISIIQKDTFQGKQF